MNTDQSAEATVNAHPPRPKIPLAKSVFDEEMKEAAVHALQNERFVLGESVYKFEEEFARYCGTKIAVSTASGTAALVLSWSWKWRVVVQSQAMSRIRKVLTTLHLRGTLTCS
ncbi:MAG: DegT/DnrJ/EryC1/StrS family aminotransferase [Candidatus Bathyarchaeia archaeon]|jgi:hypothetical protein